MNFVKRSFNLQTLCGCWPADTQMYIQEAGRMLHLQLPRHLFPQQSCSRLIVLQMYASYPAETPAGPAYSWLTKTNKYSAPGVTASCCIIAAQLPRLIFNGCVTQQTSARLCSTVQQKCSDALLRVPDVEFPPGASSHGCVSTNYQLLSPWHRFL